MSSLSADADQPVGADSANPSIAGFWPRVGASLIDGFLLTVVTAPTTFVLGYGPTALAILVAIVTAPVLWLYTVYCHGRWGKTLGKHAVGIRVVRNRDLAPIGYGRACLRDAGAILFSVLGLVMTLQLLLSEGSEAFRFERPAIEYSYELDESGELPGTGEVMKDAFSQAYAGYSSWMLALMAVESAWALAELATMLTNRRRRALHDFIGGTVVVATPSPVFVAYVPPPPTPSRTLPPPPRVMPPPPPSPPRSEGRGW